MSSFVVPTVVSLAMTQMLWPTHPGAATSAAAGSLPRRPDHGMRLAVRAGGGAEIRRVRTGSVADRSGLKAGDRIARWNGEAVSGEAWLDERRRAQRSGERLTLEVARGPSTRSVSFLLPPLAEEKIPGTEVRYGHVTTAAGVRVRTIVTRPLRRSGRLPALVLVPWLSCDPVESPHGPEDGWSHLLAGLAERSGWVTVRVEKPGVGDSEGEDCSRNDLEADLSAYRAALAALPTLDFVDTSRVVLLGASLGGALAPLLAETHPVAGLVVSGGFTKTWYEHMLEFERARMLWNGKPAAEVNDALRGYAEFYAMMLGERRTPAQVLERRPDLAALWTEGPDGQYGRPAAFFHQVAALNVERAWSRVDAPVLILYGEYDWIMSRDDHERAAAIVNARHPGRAELEVLPRTSHNLDTYASLEDARADRNGRFDEAVLRRILAWLDARFPRP